MCANMKADYTNIQKSYLFADPMLISSENALSFIFRQDILNTMKEIAIPI